MSNTRAASSRSTPMAARKLVMSRNTMPVIDANTQTEQEGDQPAAQYRFHGHHDQHRRNADPDQRGVAERQCATQ